MELFPPVQYLMPISSEGADTGAWSEPAPPSSRLRWLFLCVSAFLLALLLLSGVLVVRFLSQMRTQELAATRALAERTRSLSGLWLSIQSYDQAVQRLCSRAQLRLLCRIKEILEIERCEIAEERINEACARILTLKSRIASRKAK